MSKTALTTKISRVDRACRVISMIRPPIRYPYLVGNQVFGAEVGSVLGMLGEV